MQYRVVKNIILLAFVLSVDVFLVNAQLGINNKIFTVNYEYLWIEDFGKNSEELRTEYTQLGFAVNTGDDEFIYAPMSVLFYLMKNDFYFIANGMIHTGRCTKRVSGGITERKGCFCENFSRLKITLFSNSGERANGILVGYDLKNNLLAIYPDKKNFIKKSFLLPKCNLNEQLKLHFINPDVEFDYKNTDINKIDEDFKMRLAPFTNPDIKLFMSKAKKKADDINMRTIKDGTPFIIDNSTDTIRAYALYLGRYDKITGVLLNDNVKLTEISDEFEYTEQRLSECVEYLEDSYAFNKACKEYFQKGRDKGLLEIYRNISYRKKGYFFSSYIKIKYYLLNGEFEKLLDELEDITNIEIRPFSDLVVYENIVGYLSDISLKENVFNHFRENYPQDFKLNESYAFIDDFIPIIREYQMGTAYYEEIIQKAENLLIEGNNCHKAFELLVMIGESNISPSQNLRINFLEGKIRNCIKMEKEEFECKVCDLIASNKFDEARDSIDKYNIIYGGENSEYLDVYLTYKKACSYYWDGASRKYAKFYFEKIFEKKTEINRMVKNEAVCKISLNNIVADSKEKLEIIREEENKNKSIGQKIKGIIIPPPSIPPPKTIEEIEEDISSVLLSAKNIHPTNKSVVHEPSFTFENPKDGGRIITFDIEVDTGKLNVNRASFKLGLYKDESVQTVAKILINSINNMIKDFDTDLEIDSLVFYGSTDGYRYGGNDFKFYKNSDFSNLNNFQMIPVAMITNNNQEIDIDETTLKELKHEFESCLAIKVNRSPAFFGEKPELQSMSDNKNKALACLRAFYFASLIKEDKNLDKIPTSYKAEFFPNNTGNEYRKVTMEVYFKNK